MRSVNIIHASGVEGRLSCLNLTKPLDFESEREEEV